MIGRAIVAPLLHTLSHKKNGVDAAVILRVVCHLRVLAPNDFAARCDEAKLGHIHLDDGALGNHTKLREKRRARVLLDADDWEAECRLELRWSG